jgi:uncharacterized membrane protein YoaK (UPF0700 family)
VTPAPHLTLGLLLTAAAGMIDVVGFIELGGFYTSFMSGNTTQLGAGFTGMEGMLVALPLGLLVMFFIGSFLGALLAGFPWGGGRAVTALVLFGLAATLVLHLLGIPSTQSMLVLAASAGAQNAILTQKGAARLGATFITGTLFAAGQDLARAVRGQAPPLRWTQHLLVWLALLLGALAGAAAYGSLHLWALLLPGAIYLATLAGFLLHRVE